MAVLRNTLNYRIEEQAIRIRPGLRGLCYQATFQQSASTLVGSTQTDSIHFARRVPSVDDCFGYRLASCQSVCKLLRTSGPASSGSLPIQSPPPLHKVTLKPYFQVKPYA
eukprot:1195866-Prorocentrum_minimum.AAC.2